ncbi:MAG TPA: nitrilase-related carbon-nitrogen hydrolase, partial [Sphingopyxis terrae]|nr:nitrilase-related carbon-nitrogen hydrolase [Sphingopyxis terrae]
MTSGIDPDANLRVIDRALAAAAAEGAAMAFFPEMSLLLDRDRQRSAAHMQREADSPWPAALAKMARRHHIWLHSGSMPLLADDGERRVNR